MSKAVLFSIKPKYCELIASGKKTIEVRKTKPKLNTPFKCYIYCTKDKGISFWTGKRYAYADDRSHNLFDVCGNGKVIGEFVCDEIKEIRADNLVALYFNNPTENTCLNDLEVREYANGKNLFLWHILNLVIYDKPKELSEFEKPHEYIYQSYRKQNSFFKGVTRPPQSWGYVEELV